jgi:hypothetical protein
LLSSIFYARKKRRETLKSGRIRSTPRADAATQSHCAWRDGEAGEEFAVAIFVEPGTLDVEEFEAGHEARECERIDRELRNRLLVRASGL